MAENAELFQAACAAAGDTISVRLATGVVVTTKKITLDLRVKFEDFDFTEKFTVLDMDERYDLILGIAWLQEYEPWIDWKTKSIASSSSGGNHTFGSNDPTVVAHRRRKLAAASDDHHVGVCDVVPSQGDAKEDSTSPSVDAAEVQRVKFATPLESDRFVYEVPPTRSQRRRDRRRPPQAGVAVSHSVDNVVVGPLLASVSDQDTPVEADLDVSLETQLHPALKQPSSDGSPRAARCRVVGRQRMSHARSDSRAELKLKKPTPVLTSTVEQDEVRVMDAVTGDPISPSGVVLADLPEVSTLTELEEVSFQAFLDELQAGALAEVLVLRSDDDFEELNSSSVLDPSVVDDFRQRFESRRGSVILKNPKDPYHRLVKKYMESCLSPTPPTGLPPDRGVRHTIDVEPGSGYLMLRQWPLPKEQSDHIDAFFEEKYQQGWVRESKSPHSAPTFCVRKPNGKWRIVHAYNKLNAKTIPAQTPIPRKDVIINKMSGAMKYSLLDLVDGYYQVLMDPPDIPKTAVSTPSGMLWEWLVMPQGLSNAPATFNRLVTHLFRPLRAFASTYFDDIFVHTKPEAGRDLDQVHLDHLEQVLACMSEHKLFANLDKCIFGADEIPVLGCYVGVDGVRADPAKVRAVSDWPEPKSPKDLRKWLGLANYLHRYSANYASLARPLSDLLKKDAEWTWTPECEAAFVGIKQSLLEAPILALPDDDRPYSVVCDASDFAIGCALLQQDDEGHERVISYQSRQLKAAEKNYPVHDKELLAMKYALVKFRVHLLGSKPFVVYTDHASLRTATQSPHLSQRMARWLSFFAEYNFTVEYKPGKLNVLADALSRRPDYELSAVSYATSDLYDLIREAYFDDVDCASIMKWLATKDDSVRDKMSARAKSRLHRYEVRDGLLYFQVQPGEEPRVVVPNDDDLKYKIVYEVHDTPVAGHLGREKTYSLLSASFYWPRMYKWVSHYVRTCDVCQRVKPSPSTQAPLASLPVPSDCWRSVSLDFFFGLPKDADGNNGVLVFVDRLSKMVHLAPVADTIDGSQCAALFMKCVFRHHGLPDSIVSDRDTRFTADFWSALFRLLGTKLEMATKDHPETDGQTERANRVVEDILRSFCAASPTTWSASLPMFEFAVNNAVHATTGFTPFFLNGLRHPALPLCLMGDKAHSSGGGARQSLASQLSAISKAAVRSSVDEFVSTRVNVITRVRDAMAEAQDLQKEQADKRGRKNENVFKEGDFVLVSTKNMANDAVSSLGSSKLLPRFLGPFKILKRSGLAYTLDLPSWIRIHPTFYVGLLKPYLSQDHGPSLDHHDHGAQASANANENADDASTSEQEVASDPTRSSSPSRPPGSPGDDSRASRVARPDEESAPSPAQDHGGEAPDSGVPRASSPALHCLRQIVQTMEALVDLGELVLEIPNPTVIVSLGFNQCRDLSLKVLDRVVHVVRPGFPCRFSTARVLLTITSSRS